MQTQSRNGVELFLLTAIFRELNMATYENVQPNWSKVQTTSADGASGYREDQPGRCC